MMYKMDFWIHKLNQFTIMNKLKLNIKQMNNKLKIMLVNIDIILNKNL